MNASPTLFDEVSSYDFLHSAWKSINKSNKQSKGLSNETIENFKSNLEGNLQSISQQLREGKYRFSNVKAVVLKKSQPAEDGTIKYRPLRISEIKDRVVQKAVTLKLDALLTDKFNLDNDCSFAYRRNRNVKQAIAKMQEYYSQGYRYVLEADIKKFFDNVDKSKLIKMVVSQLPDTTLNEVFIASLDQELSNPNNIEHSIIEEYFTSSENGIPQGNPLSPLLANIYLSDFDKAISNAGYKMIRYADDFIIMCKSKDEARQALDLAKEELEGKLKLQIHELKEAKDTSAKTRIVNPPTDKFSFLSIRFDGSRCWVKEEKYKAFTQKIIEITTGDATLKVSLLDILKSLRNTIEGWIATYYFIDLSIHIPELDKLINRQLYLLFKNKGLEVRKTSIQKIKFKGKSSEIYAFTNHQRYSVGIPSCTSIWEKKL